ncbi:D-alanyl-D-alanine carboxypeptidase/D-alanyl-D-alanine-endopeptidase [Corticibacter populi]|uniref:D-alanyl-D-alanine carboxypeptidase/D-alanyl-D-alanine-endopeptidase n=1 Tax=Corticibacter populi TaxID=1550736 RepID=A0A3M6QHL7_9BURK|nr:D-alanyl-D-alanine carboxypeptidase/D-alanyl-D-alanine-endopeptidase [Corticibacter populi]RMX02594.1 D-alanyl-D-alanine carboxypeptidase/D-alanyl-D-alanine-endopeptidase [Corticibacter populi]RZS32993.1 D-alanyl-D-alanine carboxypeptidase/D-alanyl-D-alanine-endopeptidase (penicillin-binding protein 4) [Corticibacter populi]
MRSIHTRFLPRACLGTLALLGLAGLPAAQTPQAALATSPNHAALVASGEASAQPQLPAGFVAALDRAKIPSGAVSVWVQEVEGQAPPRIAYHADTPVSPASVMKLVTTYAALDQLGPAYTWKTRVYADGPIEGGSLRGNVYIQGGGDPKLVMERLWALLRQLQQRGIRVVLGDIVLDRGAYELPDHDPAAFDDEPLRPYNAAPDALLINYKSVVLRFVPDPANGVAQVLQSPPMAQLAIPATVPLSNGKGCPATWRQNLKLDVSERGRWSMAGSYPAACGELNWPVAYPDPQVFAGKAIEGMWREMGGSLTGTVRTGATPRGLRPLVTELSPPLAEVIRDVNKYSNNVMADHVFLALGNDQADDSGQNGASVSQHDSFALAQQHVQRWWTRRIGNPEGSLVIDNGSGLSRDARVTAHALALMLRHAWQAPVMPELVASLPVTGVDGTMRRSKAQAPAHLKTGSLRNVNAIAGYVHGHSGKRYVLVAIVNHANAAGARGPAFDALIDWVAED